MMASTAGGLVVGKQRGPAIAVFADFVGGTLLQASEPNALMLAEGDIWVNIGSQTKGLRVREFNNVEGGSQFYRAVVSRGVRRR